MPSLVPYSNILVGHPQPQHQPALCRSPPVNVPTRTQQCMCVEWRSRKPPPAFTSVQHHLFGPCFVRLRPRLSLYRKPACSFAHHIRRPTQDRSTARYDIQRSSSWPTRTPSHTCAITVCTGYAPPDRGPSCALGPGPSYSSVCLLLRICRINRYPYLP